MTKHFRMLSGGRVPVSAALADPRHPASDRDAVPAAQVGGVDKWDLLAALTDCATDFDLSHRELNLLRCLLTLMPERDLTALPRTVVFPSNETLAARLNGIPVSSMRRHLARLIASGLVSRQDSPNGKRYARRGQGGEVVRAFGFDLAPLIAAAPAILSAASAARERALHLSLRREDLSLLCRDLDPDSALAQHIRRRLRNRLPLAEIEALIAAGKAVEKPVQSLPPAVELSTSDSQSEQHYQNSQKDSDELKVTPAEIINGTADTEDRIAKKPATKIATLTPRTILQSCPEVLSFYPDADRGWAELEDSAERVAAMIGIPGRLLADGRQAMGRPALAATILCLLQCHARLRNPAGYLTRLIAKAREGRYSCEAFLASLRGQAAGIVS